ncbi:MAG: hypothetical protein ACLP8S_03740 [Solirubrobacteraceae bacterium]
MAFPGKSVELPEQVLGSVKLGQRAVIGEIGRFVDVFAQVMLSPGVLRGEGASAGRDGSDCALGLAGRSIKPRRAFARSVVCGAR